jgi:DNA-3-methyladenine glycosylase II
MAHTIRYRSDDAPSRALAAADPALGAVIDRVGSIEFGPFGEPFEVLAHSIVSQQLAGAAAARIWARFREQVGVAPEAVAAASDEELRAVGLSGRKAEYVHGLAAAALERDPDLDALESLSDDEVMERLTALRGIGPWTAHMFLMFGLGRPDVLALDDYGIRLAVGRLQGLGGPASPAQVAEAAERWRPYRSVALLYLWKSGGIASDAAPDAEGGPE